MKDVIHGDVQINLCVSLYCMEAVRARMLTKDKLLGDISLHAQQSTDNYQKSAHLLLLQQA